MKHIPARGFYELTREERLELTRRAVAEKRTLMERWSTLNTELWNVEKVEYPWADRSAFAATWLKGRRSVADIGAAGQFLRQFLEPGTKYVPVDCVRIDQLILNDPNRTQDEKARCLAACGDVDWESTVVVDLNREQLPVLDTEAAAALGVFEYLFDVAALLRQMRDQFTAVVATYNVSGKGPLRERENHAWVNHFTLAEFEDMLTAAGWRIEMHHNLKGHLNMWSLT
jgi:hypothetical protein